MSTFESSGLGMESTLYPLWVKLENQQCLVIGGGSVAQRKIETLMVTGAMITVIAPFLAPKIEQRATESKIVIHKRPYKDGEAADYFLTIAATNDNRVNKSASNDALKAHRLVNVVDNPALSNFYVPSLLKRGALQVGISTSGGFPGLARKIRQNLEPLFPHSYENLLDLLAQFRVSLIHTEPDIQKRRHILATIASSDELNEFINGNRYPLEKLLQHYGFTA